MPFELGKELDLKFAEDIENKINGIDDDLAYKSSRMNQIEQDAASRMTNIEQESISRDNEHKTNTKAHKAENIEYSGKVTGKSNVKDGLDSIQDQVNTIVVTATSQGNYGPEIVGARTGLDGTVHPILKNRLDKMEQGVTDANTQLKQTVRATQTLIHGPYNVLNGTQNAPVNIQIEGRTLIPMQNNILDATKFYVLADKRTWLKWADASYTKGVAKFTGKAEKPALVAVANYEGKISGSTLENPHKSTFNNQNSAPIAPSAFTTEPTTVYDKISKIDGNTYTQSTVQGASGVIMQQVFSKDIIQEIERRYGRIPRTTLADKIAWAKSNIAVLNANIHAYGVSPSGNKLNFNFWDAQSNAYTGIVSSHTSGAITKLSRVIGASVPNAIDVNGFAHFIAYAEPSTGVSTDANGGLSTLSIDYFDLEIELKPDAVLHDPRVPLYEVTQAHYNQMLVTMLEDEILRRYPSVAGPTHLQNPYLMGEGENLIPPLYEAAITLHSNAKINTPYELELNATGTGNSNIIIVPCSTNQNYSLNITHNGRICVQNEASSAFLANWTTGAILTFNSGLNTKLKIVLEGTSAGKFTFTNPMLTMGDVAKPFVPRNPSYLFFETKLAELRGVAADRVYEENGKYFVRKVIEKDLSIKSTVFNDANLMQMQFGTTSTRVIFSTGYTLPSGDHSKGDSTLPHYDDRVLATFNGTKVKQAGYSAYLDVTDVACGFEETQKYLIVGIPHTLSGWSGAPTKAQVFAFLDANDLKISYLVDPQVSEIKHEGSIFANGLTMVEVGSGAIIREKIIPQLGNNAKYLINEKGINAGAVDTPLKYKTNRIVAIYRNTQKDTLWPIKTLSSNQNGYVYGEIPENDFDKNAEYSVTYIPYDADRITFTSNPVNVTALYANNIRTALEDTAKKVEDVATETTIIKNTYAKKSKYPWIAPTLLNAWVNFGGAYATVGYTKDDLGYVHLRGLIKSGTIAQTAFVLPVGFRPEKDLLIATTSNGAFGQLSIRTDGQVFVESGSNINFSLENIAFRVEV
jgi:hypothetical protein